MHVHQYIKRKVSRFGRAKTIFQVPNHGLRQIVLPPRGLVGETTKFGRLDFGKVKGNTDTEQFFEFAVMETGIERTVTSQETSQGSLRCCTVAGITS